MSQINILGPVGYNPTGEYDDTHKYERLDVVYYEGSSYVALQESIGQLPTNTEYWACIAVGYLKQNTYDSVAEMKADDTLKDGMYAFTGGYYEFNDGGAATYKITNEESETEYQEELENGLYATLIVDKEVNVKQFGAKGDNSNNDTSFFKLFANSNVKTLYIPNGIYKINDIIDFEDKTLIGIGEPTINIFGITTAREHTFHIVGETKIRGIKFVLNVADTNILGFFGSNNSTIENCSFKVNDVACNGYVDVYTDNHNVRFLNCNFDCSSLDSLSANSYGGVWVREVYNTKETENIVFDNCKFYHRSKDEIIACWSTSGLLHNVQINNCLLEASPLATSPNLIRFDCEHSSVNNCIIIYKPSDNNNRAKLINSSDGNYEVSFNDCVFDLNLTLTNGIGCGAKLTINNSFISNNKRTKLGENCTYKSCKFKLLEIQQQPPIKLYDSIFDISQNSAWIFGSPSLIIDNCKFNFDASTQNDFILLMGNNGTISITNTTINIPSNASNKIRIGNFGSYTAYLRFINNTIPSLNVGNGSNMSGIIANNICYNSITQSTYFTYNNNINAL